MTKASENDPNFVIAMKQPTGPELFRFLDLPAEIRNEIYGHLLIYHKSVKLKVLAKPKKGREKYMGYETRLGLFPQICRTSKIVVCESFAVLIRREYIPLYRQK